MKAFPTDYFYDDETKHEIMPSEGMDLRDYFASHAPEMPSWFERKSWTKQEVMQTVKDGKNWYEPHTYTEKEPVMDWFIRWRYAYADAMMKAREK